MAENVQLNIEIKGTDSVEKASGKLQSAKTQLRELKDLLASGSLNGQEFDKVAAKAAELEDRIGDVNARVKNLANDTSLLNGFASVAQGIVGGFTAAQGAIALFGDENKDLQKTLVKVQGSVALLNGLQAVANTLNKDSAAITLLQSTRLKILTFLQARYTAVVQGTTGAIKLLRIAGAALGIGLIVAGIAALIANFDKLKKVVSRFLPSLETLGKAFTAVKNAVTDFLGITNDTTRSVEAFEKANEKKNKQLEREIEILEAVGGKEEQVYRKRALLISNNILLLERQKLAGIVSAEEYADKIAELRQQEAVLDAKYNAQKEKSEKKITSTKKEEQDTRVHDLLEALENENAAEDRQRERELEAEREFNELFNELQQEQQDEQDAEDEKRRQKRLADQQAYADSVIQIETAILDSKVGIAEQTGNLLEQIAGKNRGIALAGLAIEKGAAIANLIINTQREISGYYAAAAARSALSGGTTTAFDQALAAKQSIFAKIRAGLGIASITSAGLSSGKSILGGNAGGGGLGGGGGSQSPQIRGFSTNSLPDRQTGQQGNVKVYVTETEISNTQNRVNGVYKRALVE